MSPKLHFFILVSCAFLIGIASADIFGDFFKWDPFGAFVTGSYEENVQAKKEEEADSSPSTCTCDGPKCNCCVDFNISNVIDLGGPGCVAIRYLSESEGIAMNISYGKSVIQSQKIQNEKQGACMPLLSDLAQFCAKIRDLKKMGDETTGCLNFEPTVFGEPTSQYFVGCFRMTPDSMILDNSLTNSTEDSQEETESATKKPEEENSSFFEAVNQSAQESFEFISSLFGIDVGEKKKNKKKQSEKETEATASNPSRKGKFLPNLN